MRCFSQRGTALVLVPTMTLVLMCLGAIAVDLSLVHSVHRDAHRVASAAADDAAAMIDERALQVRGEIVVDGRRAERIARARVETAKLAGDYVDAFVVAADDSVEVTLVVDAPYVFLRGLPGHGDSTRITVVARGRLHA